MATSSQIPWKHLVVTTLRYLPFWGGVTLLFGGMGFAFSILRVDTWEASQPLLIRDEATGAAQRLGRFASQTELISAQETILEMARNREVVENALRTIGPPSDSKELNWPSAKTVDDIATSNINVRAPKSSEFGKTEVVYLATKAESPKRAMELCAAVYASLTNHLRNVRRVRADSIIAELINAKELARENLDQATGELQKLETIVGTDLGELRGLSESVTGEGNSSRVLSEVQRDMRLAELELQKIEALHQLLMRAYDNPEHLLVSDGDLLSSQPTLQRLKSGLIDAQLSASQLSGRVRPEHPTMHSANLALETIRNELRKEILTVSKSMGPSLKLAQDKVDALRNKQDSIQEKLSRLASIRTDYSGLVAEVKQRTQLYGAAQTALAEAEALRSASLSTNLLSELGPPRSSDKPIGPGTTMLTAAATAAGFLLGMGGVFLVAPSPSGQSFGRRTSDAALGRRASDSASDGQRRSDAIPAIEVVDVALQQQVVPPPMLNAEPERTHFADPPADSLANPLADDAKHQILKLVEELGNQPPPTTAIVDKPIVKVEPDLQQDPGKKMDAVPRMDAAQKTAGTIVWYDKPASADQGAAEPVPVESVKSDAVCDSDETDEECLLRSCGPLMDDRTEMLTYLEQVALKQSLQLPFQDVMPEAPHSRQSAIPTLTL
jgi:succinoglycan biosynthesis transport protein ExoP